MTSIDRRSALWLGIALSGCSGGETSVSLIFPNVAAARAVRRIKVDAYDPATSPSAQMERSCGDFIGKAKTGDRPLGMPEEGDFKCRDEVCGDDWFADQEIDKVRSGKKLVYVLAYSTIDEGAMPFLEGCNDRFDSSGSGDERNEVPIDLELVIPDTARMVKVAGDRQVGRAGNLLGVPLTIRVEADPPGRGGGSYPIPGVPLVFTSNNTDFAITSGDDPITYSTHSDDDGRALLQLRLPDRPAQGEVEVEAAALVATGVEGRSTAIFTVTVTAPIAFRTKELIATAGARPIGAALGQIIPGGPTELAVLGCIGDDATCRAGAQAARPFGATRLTVLTDLGGAKAPVPVTSPTAGFGILPAGIVVADITSKAGDDIAIANSRREACQARVCLPNAPCACFRADPAVQIDCPCEGAEVLLLSGTAAGIQLDRRLTMTGSNAVALAAVKQGVGPAGPLNVIVAAQGRSQHQRPCAAHGGCMLPYEPPGCDLSDPGRTCGCPPAEVCECTGNNCADALAVGVCVAQDKMLDQLAHRTSDELYNRLGCQEVALSCNGATMMSTCQCLDELERQNDCTSKDRCGCLIPNRIKLGDTDSPLPPHDVAAGPLEGEEEWDLVVPTLGGLGLLESKVAQGTWAWTEQPLINAPIHAAVVAQMDNRTGGEGVASPADVVWYAREACTDAPSFAERCGIWRPLPDGEEARGCLGIYFTAGARSLLLLSSVVTGGCRRYVLSFAPDGMCTGDFNADGALDVAVGARVKSELFVFAGDGKGGLLDPPEVVMLPGGVGGPMVCGDVDGDQIADVVVLDVNSGGIQLLRSGS